MNYQDGFSKKGLEDLISKLSESKQDSPSDKIPYKDVTEVLQQMGLTEHLLRVSNQSLHESEQQNKKRRKTAFRLFTISSFIIAGLSAWGGYTLANKLVASNLEKSTDSSQSQLNELKVKIQSYEDTIKEKDAQIEKLVSKVGSSVPNVSTSNIPAASSATKTTSPTSTATASTGNSSQLFDGTLAVSIAGCTRDKTSVTCSIDLSSKAERVFGISACPKNGTLTTNTARSIDINGNERLPAEIQLGSSKGNAYNCNIENSTLKDVPVKASITFVDVDPAIVQIKALDVPIKIMVKNTIDGKTTEKWEAYQARDIAIK